MCFPAKLRNPFGTQNTSHPRCFGCQATCSLTFSMNSPVHQSRSWCPPSAGKPWTVDTFLTEDNAHTTQRECPSRWGLRTQRLPPSDPCWLTLPASHHRNANGFGVHGLPATYGSGDGCHPTFPTVARGYLPCQKFCSVEVDNVTVTHVCVGVNYFVVRLPVTRNAVPPTGAPPLDLA